MIIKSQETVTFWRYARPPFFGGKYGHDSSHVTEKYLLITVQFFYYPLLSNGIYPGLNIFQTKNNEGDCTFFSYFLSSSSERRVVSSLIIFATQFCFVNKVCVLLYYVCRGEKWASKAVCSNIIILPPVSIDCPDYLSCPVSDILDRTLLISGTSEG